jgi:Resolvase, N terminal domain
MREPSPLVWDTTKWALVYLRQSSPGQVRDHVLATQEQYRLREIPERLGFSPDRILVVDDDLGVSGHTIAGRKGMLRVLELLERSEAACVVVRDVGRLSRDEFNADMGLIAPAMLPLRGSHRYPGEDLRSGGLFRPAPPRTPGTHRRLGPGEHRPAPEPPPEGQASAGSEHQRGCASRVREDRRRPEDGSAVWEAPDHE